MGNISCSKIGVRKAYASIGPSESQEQIIASAANEAHARTSIHDPKSISERDELDLHKIQSDHEISSNEWPKTSK